MNTATQETKKGAVEHPHQNHTKLDSITLSDVHKSSQIAAQGYDPVTKTLRVKFNSGGVYDYHEVPADTAANFAAADSKGSFLFKHVKNNFDFTHLNRPAEKAETS